jgi:hypothetical protein
VIFQLHRPRSSLIATAVTTLLIIAVRIAFFAPGQPPVLVRLISTAQTVNLGLSLLTNIIATAIIAIRTWYAVRSCPFSFPPRLS